MGDASNKSKSSEKSWFAGLKSEFKKIMWPDKISVAKQTVVVAVITIIVGGLIKIIDTIIQFGLQYIK